MKLGIVIAVLAACGGDSLRHIPDAPPSPSDAPSADAGPPPPVTVTVTYGGVPQPGVTAIFTNADSSPVATLQTDASGTASQSMASGGFVTVVDPFPIAAAELVPDGAPSNLYTWAGVNPGDHLQLVDPIQPAPLSFTLVTPAVANATTYTVTTACSGFSGFGSLTPPDGSATLLPTGMVQTAGCTTADVFVQAYSATPSPTTLLATLYHPALTVTPSQTVDLSATDQFTPATAATYSFSNTTVPTMFSQFLLLSSNGELPTYEASGIGSGGSATLTGDQPAIGALTAVVDSSFMTTTNSWDIVDWGVPNGNYALDLTGQVLPDVTAPPVFDYAADKLTWTAGGGAMPDFVEVAVTFTGDPAVQSWQIVAPYNGPALQFPLLAGYLPAGSDSLGLDTLETVKVPGGYDAVRAYALTPFGDYWFTAAAPNGRALIADYFGGEEQSVVRQRRRR